MWISSTLDGMIGLPSAASVAVALEIRASKPRPSAFLDMVENLPGQLAIAFRTRAVWVVQDDRLSKRRGLAELDVARDHRLIDAIREELARFLRDLLGQVQDRKSVV